MSRYGKVLDGAAHWGAFFRKNPAIFVDEYLHIRLRLFQKILLTMMFWSTTFVMISARGLGKTYLSAIYCVCRCILYPGTRICIASGTRGQGVNVLEKINFELKPASPELRAEINDKASQINGTNAIISFNNTSSIKVVTASDSSRGNRCHVLLLDEYRLISKDTIDTVLRKFLTLRRMPRYEALTEDQRQAEYSKEKNLTLYLSSAFWRDHWSYQKCVDTLRAMIDPSRKQFVCGFPYQLSIAEGLLDPEMVQDEMSEADFSEIKWSMEMGAEFYGSGDGAFFDFDSISKNRRINYPLLPDRLVSKVNNSQRVKIPPKQSGEMRLLSADIALMASSAHNNDATAVFINQMSPTKAGRHTNNIVYTETMEGLRTEEQALAIRKLFDEYNCDYLVLDTQGVGLGVFDCLARDILDPESGEIYPALSCYNDAAMAARCTVPGAPKVIWSVKANSTFNSDCAVLLREAFQNGRIRLLETEYEAEDFLRSIKGYSSLSPQIQLQFKLPYINTTLLIDELTKLEHDESGGKVKIRERSGMRKDRYSSLAYNYYVAVQLENKMSRKQSLSSQTTDVFVVKAPRNSNGKAVSNRRGRTNNKGWY